MTNGSHGYIAVFISECTVENSNINTLYQECFTLIKASSLEEAKQKAIDHANNTVNVSYANEYGKTVTWVVKQIIEVTNTLEDKFDLYADAVDLYVRGFEDYEAYQRLLTSSESELET
jgi:uncharacterized alkaline shock family protein YloU